MKYSYYVIAFVLAVATAYALSQTPSNPSTPPNAAQQQQASPSTMPDQPAATGDQDTPHPGQQDQQRNPNGADASANAAQGAQAGESPTNGSADASLQTQIQQQLAAQSFSGVNVTVKDGVATLTGSVPSKEDRKRAKELAKNVPGVKRVSEKLSVNPNAASSSPGSTSGATNNTAGSIAGNAGSTQAPVTSTTAPSTSTQAQQSGGVSGSTSTTTTGTGMPQSSTGTVAGSEQPLGAPASSAATATESADASELQSRIDGALKNEPTLASSHVSVNVTGETIELSGSVPSGKEKTTAQRIAQSFAGNRKVADKIAVTGMGADSRSNPPDKNRSPK